MRPAFHVFVSLAGALTFGAGGAAWCALSESSFEAGALTMIQSGATTAGAPALGSLRALVESEPVLRRAALRPEAAAIVEKSARPSALDRLTALARARPSELDTLSRAAEMLAPRIDLRPGPLPDTIEILARMPTGADAASVATAVAESFVVEINEIGDQARKRMAQARSARLDAAARRLDEARTRQEALRAADPVSTSSIAPTRDVQPALDPVQRAAVDAAARLTEATRVYGPRHPLLIEAETAARRAQAALQVALQAAQRRKIGASAPAQNPSEGGPDPRAGEIAAAEQETARAEAAYDLEMARAGADRREARVLKPAAVPIRSNAPSSLAIVGGSALLGFLLTGFAPNFAPGSKRSPIRRTVADRRLARLRDGALDWVAAERVLEILGVGEGRTARIIEVAGDDPNLASIGAGALTLAALAAGWRPLLVSDPENVGRLSDHPRRPLILAGATFFATRIDTEEGPYAIAAPAGPSTSDTDAVDAALAFDLVVIDTARADPSHRSRIGGRADCIVRVAAALSDAAAADLLDRLHADDDRFAGTILTAREA
jgi:hypothetical protein